ncbi:MAG: hypothetical protein E7612_01920 [Ruminococcaceae bacterium]|nr:hypothetical protein [Oscillospiraceae bacterium]
MGFFERGSKRTSSAKIIALVGIMAATLECAKLALMFLPNIEVVTILLALYGYVFGIWGVAAAFVFVCIEPLIYGFGTWVVSYFLYWPLVALVFMIFARLKIKNRIVFTLAAAVLTIWFGVLTSLVDIGLFSGFFDNFWHRFGVYYLRGIPFYAAQLACNVVLFLLLFKFLTKKLEGVKKQFI